MRWFTLKSGLLWGHYILKVYTSLFYPKWDDRVREDLVEAGCLCLLLAWCHHWHWVWCEDTGLPAPAHTGPRSQRPEPEPERSELAWLWAEARRGRPPRPRPTSGAGQAGELKLWARVVVAVVTRLQRRPAEERGERSPRPVTLQATPLPAGLGPHSQTPTTLFVTLQRMSCNIFLPPEIKQSGSYLGFFYRMRKITSDNQCHLLSLF